MVRRADLDFCWVVAGLQTHTCIFSVYTRNMYIHVYVCLYMYICICMSVYICIYKNTLTYGEHVCSNMTVSINIRVYIYVYVNVCIYIHIWGQRGLEA